MATIGVGTNTTVKTLDDKNLPVGAVPIGTFVMGWNENSRTKDTTQVIAWTSRTTDKMYRLRLSGYMLDLASEHKVLTSNGWVSVDKIIPEQSIKSLSGAWITVKEITVKEEETQVCNLECTPYNSFYANGLCVQGA